MHCISFFMRTRLTSRGRVSIPSVLRRKLKLKAQTLPEWVVEGDTLRAIPIPDDPMAALRGSGKKGAVARLLAERARDELLGRAPDMKRPR
jgi:bifunctional DNA-binding transcriptional regulator/antitoxin component of YhaV-PrlF toxin-antitoxin module